MHLLLLTYSIFMSQTLTVQSKAIVKSHVFLSVANSVIKCLINYLFAHILFILCMQYIKLLFKTKLYLDCFITFLNILISFNIYHQEVYMDIFDIPRKWLRIVWIIGAFVVERSRSMPCFWENFINVHYRKNCKQRFLSSSGLNV